jgi:hypothetical protein
MSVGGKHSIHAQYRYLDNVTLDNYSFLGVEREVTPPAQLILMLVTMYLGRMPIPVKQLTWVLFGVYVLQADVVIFLRTQAPVIFALHPVLALVDFALGLALARRAWLLLRQAPASPNLGRSSEMSSNS